MTKLPQKRNLSCTQVIKTLQLLLQNSFSMSELIDKLNENEQDSIFNNSVISKYINTCRYYGIDIPKINNKYYVAHLPFGIKLTLEDIDNFKRLQEIVLNTMSVKYLNMFNNFLEKINRFSDKQIIKIDKNCIEIPIEIFEKAVANKRKVKLLFKNQNTLECIPLNMVENNNKRYFKVYCKKERFIDIKRLSGLEIMDNRFVSTYGGEQSVIFRLYAPLAQRYEARENENITLNSDGSINVINRSEPKDVLFARLLRYDTKCTILSPKSYRTEFRQIINDTLKNYEEG